MVELILENLIIPFGQAFLYDISKAIYKKKHDKNQLQDKLKKAIDKSVNEAIPNNSDFNMRRFNMCLSIIASITEVCITPKNVNIFQIVKEQFLEWNEENLNPTGVATDIYNNLEIEIMADPELCVLFTQKMQMELVREIIDMKSQLEKIETGIANMYKFLETSAITMRTLASTRNGLLLEIVNENLRVTQNVKNIIDNSKFIASSYQEYFIRPLFLEKRMPDKKAATLYDVYIENKYYILDFQQQNSKKTYVGILQFITDFIRGNLRNINYGTTYAFNAEHIKILFIKGHPGSGKSSLFYYLAYLKSHDINFLPDYKFYFIKLIELFDANDGRLNVQQPIYDIQNQIGFDFYLDNTVLVLDGLDEICVARNFDINEYCYNLIRNVSNHDRLRVIITTRLNYIRITHNDNKNVFNIQLCNLDIQDLKEWVDKYFSIHKSLIEEKTLAQKNISYIEKNEKNQIIEILAIPLLFYMIVVSKMDISQITSIGELYDYVFKELRDRNYNEEDEDFKQKHGVNKRISEKLARQIAIEISKKMYDKNVLLLKINSEELQDAMNKAFLIEYSLKEDDKKEIEKLFPITFFYKEALDVVEFAHKSIMEFFVAEKLYQSINEYNDITTYIEKFMLEPIITNEVLDYYSYFIKRDGNIIVQKYSNIVEELKRIIYEKRSYSSKNVTFPYEMCKVVFKIYWYFIREIVCCDVAEINAFLNEDIMRRYILGILSIKDSGAIAFLDNSVIRWNFKSLVFKKYTFSYCNLKFVDFSRATFEQCSFMYSNLDRASFNALRLKSYIQFLNCSMNGIKIRNLQLDLQDKPREKKIDKQTYVLELKGVSLDDAEFADLDLRKVNFTSIVSMKDAKIKNVKMNLKQLVYFEKFQVNYENITIFILAEDFSVNELREVRKIEDKIRNLIKDAYEEHLIERKKQEILEQKRKAEKYINDAIAKKMKKGGVHNEIISKLKISLNDSDFCKSSFFYS